ncbi:MAG: TfoX/Sxy family protein [Chloroflexota bacterium]
MVPQPMKDMEWKKPSKELGELLEAAVSPLDCRKKLMFGAPVYVVNHNMFTGVHGDNIFVRLSPADQEQIVKSYPPATPFEPLKGRVMKEYLVVPAELYRDEPAFRDWLRRAYDYAASLPPKKGKR